MNYQQKKIMYFLQENNKNKIANEKWQKEHLSEENISKK